GDSNPPPSVVCFRVIGNSTKHVYTPHTIPRVIWDFTDYENNIQNSYLVVLSTDPGFTTLLWNTGWVASAQKHVDYNGTYNLERNTEYYLKLKVSDGCEYSEVNTCSFIINDRPSIAVTKPGNGTEIVYTDYEIKWNDSDSDNNASISLYYCKENTGNTGTLIISGISENPDGAGDIYKWDISGIPEGEYYILAEITDGYYKVYDYSSGKIQVKHSADDLNNVIAYPNPCKQPTVKFKGLTLNTKICLYSISGELIKEEETDLFEYEMDISGLASGVYLYTVENQNQKKNGKIAVLR
ncbi:MAG: T9SS type A sorting domain-containing protein, partial [bacterium]|nr:T9SS type A sorting domain-containing protein [bacterium]